MAHLTVIKAPDDFRKQQQITLSTEGPMNIGRNETSSIHLSHKAVSREHAEITGVGDKHSIKDVGSRNGTFVNGEKIQECTELTRGDVIKICGYQFTYNDEDAGGGDDPSTEIIPQGSGQEEAVVPAE